MVATSGYSSRSRVALVVEPNPALRRLTSTILRQSGFKVREQNILPESVTTDADESFELLVMNANAGDAAMADHLKRSHPEIRIIITGASEQSDECEWRSVPRSGFTYLSVPFSFARLSHVAQSSPAGAGVDAV